MNLTKDYYLDQLIKQNFLYIICFIIFLFLGLYLLIFQISTFNDKKTQIETLKKEVQKLKNSKTIIASFKRSEINSLFSTLNLLIPDKEDYFSIVATIENLSKITDYKINTYNVAFNSNSKEKITIQIDGEGSLSEFLLFLQKYQYDGGRLITIDRINFTNDRFKSNLTLNFYTKAISVSDKNELKKISNENIVLYKKIAKANEVLIKQLNTTDEELPDNNVSKSNPFR